MAARNVSQAQTVRVALHLGNPRGLPMQSDGRRGSPAFEGDVHPNWVEIFKELEQIPLNPRVGAAYLYVQVDGAWVEEVHHTTVAKDERSAQEAEAEVSMQAIRDVRAVVAQEQQLATTLNERKTALQEQVTNLERTIAAQRAEAASVQALLHSERARYSSEVRTLEERLAREAKSVEDTLAARRAMATKETDTLLNTLGQQVASALLLHTKATELGGELLESEGQALKHISARRRNDQVAAHVSQTAWLDLEAAKIESLESLGTTPVREKPMDRLANGAAEFIKNTNGTEVLSILAHLLGKKAPAPE